MAVNHEHYMQRCLQLAQKAAGKVAPNPLVGAVLVYQDRIIGEGYHEQYGQAHAEVNCINSVAKDNQSFIHLATLYVSLEPCAHYGKTPPCTQLIIQHQIKRVVIGCLDPFEAVNGKGAAQLKAAGIEVIGPILEEACKAINRRFFHFHIQKRPYIILKWAQTTNGLMGLQNQRIAISQEATKRLVHQWRSTEAAILVGTNTVRVDNPQLNNRHWYGPSPLRMIIDKQLQLQSNLTLFNDGAPTWIFNAIKQDNNGVLQYIQIDTNQLIPSILHYAYTHQVQSILVEGGLQLLQGFIDSGLWEEAYIITASQFVLTDNHTGVKAPDLIHAQLMQQQKIGSDLIHYYKKSQ